MKGKSQLKGGIMADGYEITYEAVRKKLLSSDFEHAEKYLGFEKTGESTLKISFLNRDYAVGRDGTAPCDGLSVNPNILSVIVYYAVSSGRAEPLYKFSLLKNLTKGLFSGGDSLNWFVQPLLRKYGKDYPAFREKLLETGMKQTGEKSGAYTWQYLIFPKVPLQIVYYEEDDEFPCGIQIMYDVTVSEYFEFEPLAVMSGCLVRELASD